NRNSRVRKSAARELGGGEVADLVDKGLNAAGIHSLAVQLPIGSAAQICFRITVLGDIDFSGITETEIKELLRTEVVERLRKILTEVGRDFECARYHAALGVVVILVLSQV